MNIGIIVFSRTGNTLAVAEKICDSYIASGHTAKIERVHAQNEDPGTKTPVVLTNIPDPTKYDALVFGSPVEGFSLPAVMTTYMKTMPGISDKKVFCFVTQHLPKPWMGGTRTLKQMCEYCMQKGAELTGTGGVNIGYKNSEAQQSDIISRFCKI